VTDRTCTVDGCRAKRLARGWCSMHYARWRRWGDPLREVDTATRFWSKVDKDGPVPSHMPNLGPCWVWTAGGGRYGQFSTGKGRNHLAHRFAYELTVGPIPAGLLVCHHCDNGLCVRPEHLFVGTQLLNRRDCVQKGRTAKGERVGVYTHPESRASGDRNGLRVHPERAAMGERNARAKLTAPEVLEIRRLYGLSNATFKSLGERFGVSESQIYLIVHRKKWKHI
jgi:HNH endonuclease